MRTLIVVAMILCLGPLAQAKQYRIQKKVNSVKLLQELSNAGIRTNSLECPSSYQGCVLHLPDKEKRDPGQVIKAHVYEDWEARSAQARGRMRELAEKWRGGDLTPQEKDELLKLLVFQMVGLR